MFGTRSSFATFSFAAATATLMMLGGAGYYVDAGEVYLNVKDVPRTRKFQKITLKEADGSPKMIEMVATLVEMEQARSQQELASGIRKEKFHQLYLRKTVRLGVNSIDKSYLPVRMIAKVVVIEEGVEIERADDVFIEESAPRWIVDFMGFVDATGTFGTPTGEEGLLGKPIIEKGKHAVGEIVRISVEVESKGENILYRGGWPKAPEAVPEVATQELKRTITSSDGRKIDAFIKAIGEDSVTIVTDGETFTIPFNQLSDDDWDYFQTRKRDLDLN